MSAPGLQILFGGSFDPVHEGHAGTARAVLDHFPGATLTWLPAARSPLKAGSRAEASERLAMLRTRCAGEPGWQVSEDELHRPPPSYTIDTLKRWRLRAGPDTPLAFLMGRDSLATLLHWRDWADLTEHAHLIVAHRPGGDAALPPVVAAWLENRHASAPDLLQSRPFGLVLTLTTPPWPVSSTAIRQALAAGAPTGDWLSPGVRDYIQQHGLYRSPETPGSP